MMTGVLTSATACCEIQCILTNFVEDFFRSNSESIYDSNLKKAASLLFIHDDLFSFS